MPWSSGSPWRQALEGVTDGVSGPWEAPWRADADDSYELQLAAWGDWFRPWAPDRVPVDFSTGVAWRSADSFPTIFANTEGMDSVSVAMNNAWWGGIGGGSTWAVLGYDDGSGVGVVRVSRRPRGGTSSDWVRHYEFPRACLVNAAGDVVGFPCLAVRELSLSGFEGSGQGDGDILGSSRTGSTLIAVAYRGTGDELWVSHNGRGATTGARWEMEDVAVLAGREPGAAWSTPAEVNDGTDYTDGTDTESYFEADFPSITVSGIKDPAGVAVLVAFSVQYDSRRSPVKQVRGKAMLLADLEAAGWDISGATEMDIGGSAECRDPCAVSSYQGLFLVFYAWPTAEANIQVRYVEDPSAASPVWSAQVEVCADDPDGITTQLAQNFPNAAIDGRTGSCVVTWEDVPEIARFEQTPFGAVCDLADPSRWLALGNLTELPIATTGEEGSYPVVAASQGVLNLFYLTPSTNSGSVGEARVMSRRGAL